MKLGLIWVQYHRMPKYLNGRLTFTPSHIRVFRRSRKGWKFLIDFNVPKYGRVGYEDYS